MQMLHDVMDTLSKKLTLHLPIKKLQKSQIKQLKDLFKIHKGDKQVYFTVYEPNDKIKLTMAAKKQKITISKELLEEMDTMDVYYKLN